MTTIASTSPSSAPVSSTPSNVTPPVAVSQTPSVADYAGLTSTAVTLSADGNIAEMLSGVSASSLTYNANGLMSSLVQVATEMLSAQNPSSSSSSSTSQTSSPLSSTSTSTSTTPASSSAAGVYNSSGALSTNSSWASALKANPALAATVSADTFDQGIVGTLSTTA